MSPERLTKHDKPSEFLTYGQETHKCVCETVDNHSKHFQSQFSVGEDVKVGSSHLLQKRVPGGLMFMNSNLILNTSP